MFWLLKQFIQFVLAYNIYARLLDICFVLVFLICLLFLYSVTQEAKKRILTRRFQKEIDDDNARHPDE